MEHSIQAAGNLFSVFFVESEEVRDFDGCQRDRCCYASRKLSSTPCSTTGSTCRRRTRSGSSRTAIDEVAIDGCVGTAGGSPSGRRRTGGTGVTTTGSPAAPRRGAQPERRAVRPVARLPPVRARCRHGRADRRDVETATSCRSCPRRWSGPGDGGAHRHEARARRCVGRAADRGRGTSSKDSLRPRRGLPAAHRSLEASAQPVPAVVG